MTLTLSASFLLGLIQGIGEFLPVSSSAHVAFVQSLLGIPYLYRTVEISLHLGTLMAVIVYFFPTFWKMLKGAVLYLIKKETSTESESFGKIVIATIPAVIVGYLLHTFLPYITETLLLMGLVSILTGIWLYNVDKTKTQNLSLDQLSYKHALVIGLFQCIAFIPGASRLGMTLLGARFLGYDRFSSLIFSYWISVPVVLGALVLNSMKVLPRELLYIDGPLFTGILTSFFIGLAVIHFFIQYLKNASLGLIMIYRILFGLTLIIYTLTS